MSKRAQPELPTDWEDAFHRLKEQYNELKVQYNDKVEDNKILQAKIHKLENDLAAMDRQLGNRRGGKVSREEEEMIGILNEQLNRLKSQNAVLSTKLTQTTEQLEKKKREVHLLKKTAYLRKGDSSRGQDRGKDMELEIEPAASHVHQTRPTTPAPTNVPPNLLDVAKKYKERISFLEEQLESVKAENGRLRQ
eukprot:gene35816-43443_t